MKDVAYERFVGRLEGRYAGHIASTAVLAARKADADMRHEAAIDAVEDFLMHELTWQHVAAADISDIAHEAADKAVNRLI